MHVSSSSKVHGTLQDPSPSLGLAREGGQVPTYSGTMEIERNQPKQQVRSEQKK